MKKILSFILLIAIIAAPALYAPSVSANTVGKTPDRAPTGERICEIKFGGSSADYAPHAFGPACGTGMPGISVSSDGSELTLTTAEGQTGGVFYGGADYPFHQTGLSLGRCYTFGMLAAKHAMGQL